MRDWGGGCGGDVGADLRVCPFCNDFRHFATMFAKYAAFRCKWALVVERALRATPYGGGGHRKQGYTSPQNG